MKLKVNMEFVYEYGYDTRTFKKRSIKPIITNNSLIKYQYCSALVYALFVIIIHTQLCKVFAGLY